MKPESTKAPLRVGLISLGCAKNLVDAEVMLGTLLRDGAEITNNVAEADAVIVNTCSFIDSAQEESVDAILESGEVREAKNRGQALIVSGCLPQRFRDELPTLLPEVDAFMGIDQVANVTEVVRTAMARRQQNALVKGVGRQRKRKVSARLAELNKQGGHHHDHNHDHGPAPTTAKEVPTGPLVDVNLRPKYIPDYATPRFRLTPNHFAYLKIAEGCNHPCSFCIIPRMRGSHRSRPQADIVAEAKALIESGVREINLISQDSTYYGLDLRPGHRRTISSPLSFTTAVQELPEGSPTLCTLLRELNALPGDFWIRLLYTHPAHWTDELIQTIAECPKVARYADIPLQHIHENMLERMRRETSQQHIVDLVRKIREGVPGMALRTTFIVGFPGETDACFDTLMEFIRDTRFERLGVFTYSQEEGTRAGSMAGQLPDKLKRQRRDRAMALQRGIAAEISAAYVGRTLNVLVERPAAKDELQRAQVSSWEHGLVRGEDHGPDKLGAGWFVARGEADAPDIDGRVYVRGKVAKGEFVRVKITGHTDYDLLAEPA